MATVTSRDLRWSSGILIGLLAAGIGVVVLLVVGLLSGRGSGMITIAGAGMLPRAVSAGTNLSPAAAYLPCPSI